MHQRPLLDVPSALTSPQRAHTHTHLLTRHSLALAETSCPTDTGRADAMLAKMTTCQHTLTHA